MKGAYCEVNVIFNENGATFLTLIDEIISDIINSHKEGELNE